MAMTMRTTSSTSIPQNLPQRIVRHLFATREFAVLGLVSCCIIVEIAILFSTQRYEAQTAPAGTILFLGMSAGGLVVFFAEVLKLPIAWVSGVVTGWTRLFLNLLAAFLCLLTAMTVKDLTTREWDLGLKPARAASARAKEIGIEIETLEQKKTLLAQDSKESGALWGARIFDTNSQLDAMQNRKADQQSQFIEQFKAITEESMDAGAREQVKALEAARDRERETFEADINALRSRLTQIETNGDASKAATEDTFAKELAFIQQERKSVAEQNAGAEARAQQQYEAEQRQYSQDFAAYEGARKEYETNRQSVQLKRDQDLAELEKKDGAFFNIEKKQAEVRDVAETELKRLESDFKTRSSPQTPKRIAPKLNPLPALPIRPAAAKDSASNPEAAAIKAQIDEKARERNAAQAARTEEISAVLRKSEPAVKSVEDKNQARRAELQKSHDELVAKLNKQYADLMDIKSAQEEQRAETLRSPDEIERERREIQSKIAELKREAEQTTNEAKRLSTDTNATRAASGIVRWFLPNASDDQLQITAYGIYPVVIGVLVAFLPALLLELGMHSLVTPPNARKRSEWHLWHRFNRGRRALIIERGRAAAAQSRAEDARRNWEASRETDRAQAEKRTAEVEQLTEDRTQAFEQRRVAFEREMESGRETFAHSVAAKALELHESLVSERDNAVKERHEIRRIADEEVARAYAEMRKAVESESAQTEQVTKQNEQMMKQAELIAQQADQTAKQADDIKRLAEKIVDLDASAQ